MNFGEINFRKYGIRDIFIWPYHGDFTLIEILLPSGAKGKQVVFDAFN